MPPVVAYLGPVKTNTHLAALRRFGSRCRYVHAPTVEDVFHMVERREADFGVVPVENSLEGAVAHTLDRFVNFWDSPAKIFGEIDMPVQHCLLMRPTTRRQKVRVIYSHPQALAQCRRWLEQNFPNVSQRETRSTAEAADELLARRGFLWKMNQRAAIGSPELAREHGLKAEPIPVDRDNRTRFLVISLRSSAAGRRNKTSVMFALKDKPGALHDALVPFKRNGINLTKIESRPSKQKAWEYVFFVDVRGAVSDGRVKRALRSLERCTAACRVLGSYSVRSA